MHDTLSTSQRAIIQCRKTNFLRHALFGMGALPVPACFPGAARDQTETSRGGRSITIAPHCCQAGSSCKSVSPHNFKNDILL